MTTASFVGSIALGGGFFGLDQWSKRMMKTRLANRSLRLGSIVRLRLATHREDFYGRRVARVGLIVAWCVALVSATLLYRVGAWFHGPAASFGLALALGGAAGNLTDILRRRSIINFIDVGWWPVFNLADAGIVSGLIAAFLARG